MALEGPVLRDPAHRVSPKARRVWTVRALLVGALGAVALLAAHWIGLLDVPTWAWAAYVAVALAYAAAMPAYRYRVHRWETTATAVYTQRGWLSTERRIAPMSRVQTVDLDQGVVERVFGLATVTVTTASAAGPLKVEGLDLAVAGDLVDELTRRTEAEPGDAT